ncbi:MAG: DUF4368 domain-containing protein [Clostridia bacterium]|nr:DUF4368 domain-containing protein [Clostridia bacterium]
MADEVALTIQFQHITPFQRPFYQIMIGFNNGWNPPVDAVLSATSLYLGRLLRTEAGGERSDGHPGRHKSLQEKILIHEPVKLSKGLKEQGIEIFYRFVGKID